MMLVKEEQPEKQYSLNADTDDGIVTLTKEEQPEKHPNSNSVTDDGIVTLAKEEQSEYLQPIITQYFIDNKSEIWLLFLIAHSKR